ncbi:MAG: response regulator transcription factor [Candidatus Andersenbacteria bacterium]
MSTPPILILAEGELLQRVIVRFLVGEQFARNQLLVASTSAEATRMLAARTFSLVLISACSIDQHSWVKKIRSVSRSTPIFALHLTKSLGVQEQMVAAGAQGVFSWRCSWEEILEGVHEVLAERVCLPEQLLHYSNDQKRNSVSADPITRLSPREQEVFGLIGKGIISKQIAGQLHISPKSVETYRAMIKKKLNLSSGAQLITAAVSHALENT